MPDTKITALTAIGANPIIPATFPIPMVDLTDTSMAASGTTKKVTVNQILGAGGTATLASATITGDLTVDTSTLKVDSVNNRVGIGTATPATDLHIQATGSASAELRLAAAGGRSYNIGSTASGYGSANNLIIYDITGSAERYRLDASGNHFWNNVGGVAGTAMTLNSTGLGVGGVPDAKFKVFTSTPASGVTTCMSRFACGSNVAEINETGSAYSLAGAGANELWFYTSATYSALTIGSNGAVPIKFISNGAERVRIDTAGNCGIGVAPSAWGATAKAIQIGSYSGIYNDVDFTVVVNNAFFNGTNNIYRNTAPASQYYQQAGSHVWRTAPSGTAGNTITYTQAMTLDASGNLLCGSTALNATWNTRLTLSSDSGTTRWAVGPYSTATNFVISAASGGGVYLNGTAATSWTSASDERLKDIIEPISNAIAKVGSLRAVIGKFKSDDTNTRKSFLMAQDVQSVLPEAVDASNPDRLGLAYTDVIPLLVAAIKELTAEVNALKNA